MSGEIVTDRTLIFQAIRLLMARYAPPLQPRTDVEGRYELWSPGPVAVEGEKAKHVFFAGLIIQSSYVGFYFMPLAADASARVILASGYAADVSPIQAAFPGRVRFLQKPFSGEMLAETLAALGG